MAGGEAGGAGLSPRLSSGSVVVVPPVGAHSAVFDSYTGSTSPCSLLLGFALSLERFKINYIEGTSNSNY